MLQLKQLPNLKPSLMPFIINFANSWSSGSLPSVLPTFDYLEGLIQLEGLQDFSPPGK